MAPPKPKPKPAAPKEGGVLKTLLLWGFILLMVGGITVMIMKNPKSKTMTCNRSVATTLTSFGSCSEE